MGLGKGKSTLQLEACLHLDIVGLTESSTILSRMLISLPPPWPRVHLSPAQVAHSLLSRPVHSSPRAALWSSHTWVPRTPPDQHSQSLKEKFCFLMSCHSRNTASPFPTETTRAFFPGPDTYAEWYLVFSTHPESYPDNIQYSLDPLMTRSV